MSVEAIAAEGLACQRGGRVILSDLAFELRAGAALLLRGPNGSGKTTLLRTIAGFTPPARGSLRITRSGGIPEKKGEDGFCHYIGHLNGIKPRLSALENVSFWQRYYQGQANLDAAEAALEAFDLLHLAEFSAAHLSQGQARRLALARLLAAHRPVWLLDEPSVSLDAASTKLLEVAVARHRARGGMVIAAIHGELLLDNAAILSLGGTPALQ